MNRVLRRLMTIGLFGFAFFVVIISILLDDFAKAKEISAQSNQDSPLATSTLTSSIATPTPVSTPTTQPQPESTGPPTDTPTITLTPSPSPTKGIVADIAYPRDNDVLFANVVISGTALIQSYQRYEIHIASAGSESWQWLMTNYPVVRGGELFQWDTTSFADGFYDLRLRAISENSNYNEAFVRSFEIRNRMPPTATPQFDEQGTLIPVTNTPTPTETPDVRIRVPGGQGFYAPVSGALLQGYIPIIATVNNFGHQTFDRYELYVSLTGAEEWSLLTSKKEQHWQDSIYVLNTKTLVDGFYDLRLQVVFKDGNYRRYHLRNLEIANAKPNVSGNLTTDLQNGIHYPVPGKEVGGVVDFVGTAVDPNFLRWEL
ncbi:hypothetical protein KFU94_19415 [Chloroflexi bacterium TSY]|nr:hypothetical protein [Chloroflexi bacterium TSY]